ncbi:PspA/IM30 family protein [Bogoriella caseilytica]|uniref:Phage shock protein A (PspA) family protein n=1 Tax=Bogoriella caseilytica TaxID=56055 RepID=A0A3N2BFI3_9MICO|nr:PspA/IM30 family protein [Bogoriella caseilytica]ROR74002.1 phage shock protein A (PspA) family protein [Bogoriella caseilytica]
MAQKQTILGRISQLTKANINALLDRAEDPQKMLDQLVRDYTNSIREAEDAVAQTIGSLRLAEQDHASDLEEAKDWGNKALAAANRASQLREAGNAEEAERFENLARVAVGKQIAAEDSAKTAEPAIASQREVVEKLKTGLTQMRTKLTELTTKRDQLVARAKTAQAQSTVQSALSSINVLDPTTEVSRFEDQVRREEARVAGHAELQGASLESQFAELEDHSRDAEIEARLAALRKDQ